MCALYLLMVSVAFRAARTNIRTAAFLTRLFLLSLPVAGGLYWITPDNLGFLPASLIENPAVELVFLLFTYSSLFFGGMLQVYGLADRGFSLRISIDIDKAGGCMTVPEVIKDYSMGKGTHWMYKKRVDGLLALKLTELHGDQMVIRPEGRRIAAPLHWIRAFLRVEA